MSFLLPILIATLVPVAAAFLFLGLVPRYFLGARRGSGIAGFKDRREVVQSGCAACFVATIPLAAAIALVSLPAPSLTAIGENLGGIAGSGLSAPASGAVTQVTRLLDSALYRAKSAYIGVGIVLDLLLIASVLAAVLLSRDMSREAVVEREREHVIELDDEARKALERQEG
jgi:hypothetical protein